MVHTVPTGRTAPTDRMALMGRMGPMDRMALTARTALMDSGETTHPYRHPSMQSSL